MQAAFKHDLVSVEDYLAGEQASELKHEYVGGAVYAMAGASREHNEIMKNPIFQELAQAASKGEPVALGIISGVKGSSPQKVGAKAIFYADGRIKGTLGGGCLEAEIQQRAVESLRTGKASTFDLLLDHDFGWDDGLICGGKVFGVILPNAQSVGEKFWQDLAERNSTLTWG